MLSGRALRAFATAGAQRLGVVVLALVAEEEDRADCRPHHTHAARHYRDGFLRVPVARHGGRRQAYLRHDGSGLFGWFRGEGVSLKRARRRVEFPHVILIRRGADGQAMMARRVRRASLRS